MTIGQFFGVFGLGVIILTIVAKAVSESLDLIISLIQKDPLVCGIIIGMLLIIIGALIDYATGEL